MPTPMNLDRIVWLDIETTGLDPIRDLILEVGFRITTPDLETIDDFQMTIWDSPGYDTKYDNLMRKANTGGDRFVWDMHIDSGLWQAAQSEGMTLDEAKERMLSWLSGHGIDRADAVAGSSVQFDRNFMQNWFPDVNQLFSYRIMDISTVKEFCARWNPGLYANIQANFPTPSTHRVLDCLTGTVKEAGLYAREFLITGDEFDF